MVRSNVLGKKLRGLLICTVIYQINQCGSKLNKCNIFSLHRFQIIAVQAVDFSIRDKRSQNSATCQLQWPWAHVAIERLLAHLGYCYPHHIAFATVGTGSSSNSLHSSKAPTAKLTGRLTLNLSVVQHLHRLCSPITIVN